MPFIGRKYSNVRVAKWKRFYASVIGYPYNHATESTTFGLRTDGQLVINQGGPKDSNERDVANHDTAEFTASILQTDMGGIQTVLKLAREPHNLWLPSAHGDFFSFVPNTAGPLEPNGTQPMGLHVKLMITKDDRNIECKWACRMFPAETEYLYNNTTSIIGGAQSGGSAIGINSGMAYDWDKYRPSSFHKILVNGEDVGAIGGGTQIELESKPWTTIQDQEIMQYLMANCVIELGQSTAQELIAAYGHRNSDIDIEFQTGAGDTFKLLNGAGVIAPEFNHSDKEASLRLRVGGEIPSTFITFPDANTMEMDFSG